MPRPRSHRSGRAGLGGERRLRQRPGPRAAKRQGRDTALEGQRAVPGWGPGVAVTGWHLAASPPRSLQSSEAFPAGLGDIPHLPAGPGSPREAGTLPPSPKPARQVAETEPQVDSGPLGSPRSCFVLPLSPGPASPMKEWWQQPQASCLRSAFPAPLWGHHCRPTSSLGVPSL